MRFNTFWDLITEVKKYPRAKLCVAAAADEVVLRAVKDAVREELVEPILVGRQETIWNIAVRIGLDLSGVEIVDESNPVEAARLAALRVGQGGADILMKGMVNSSDFLRAVLHPENGLATGNILSHLAIFEVPGFSRFIFKTDGGLNISPDLVQKKKIIANAIAFLQVIGVETPRVAVLSPRLLAGGKLPSAADADELKTMASRGEFGNTIVEGPLDLGVAVDPEAARALGIGSAVAGKADLLVVPNIEVGNVLGKTIIYLAGGKMAGLVIGAAQPVILTSRGDSPLSKLSSVAFACYYLRRRKSAPAGSGEETAPSARGSTPAGAAPAFAESLPGVRLC